MTICGHQFYGGDGSDWVLSTSVGCLDESTTASRILQELFKKCYRNPPTEVSGKSPKTVIAPSPKRTAPPKKKHQPQETLIVRRIPNVCALENFDESQHLSGCPVKWLYNKRLLEKKKRLRVQRLCAEHSPRKEEVKREKANLRDRTPVEMKIHKINLMEKYTIDSDDVCTEKPEAPKDLDAHRKQLAAKLNWKLHDDSQEEPPYQTFSETGSRHNYLPPRPLLGLKPLLSVLLAPHKTNCCSFVTQLRGIAPTEKGRRASLSIQCLDLSLPQPEPAIRPLLRSSKALRWGSKSSISAKKLQIPNQITVKLDQKKHNFDSDTQNEVKVIYHNPSAKRMSEQRKQTKSLSSLFYELRGKTSHRAGQQEEVLEEIIGDLAVEGQSKMKWFLNLNFGNTVRGCKHTSGTRGEIARAESGGVVESNPVCGKIRFFKKPHPKRINPRRLRWGQNPSTTLIFHRPQGLVQTCKKSDSCNPEETSKSGTNTLKCPSSESTGKNSGSTTGGIKARKL